MAQTVEQSPYFTERRSNGGLIVSDAPKFDLESYAANYDRMSRYVYHRSCLSSHTTPQNTLE